MERSLTFLIIAFVITFLLSPVTIKLLKKFKLVRGCDDDPTAALENRKCKAGVPIMGGALVVVVVAVMTLIFNRDESYTLMPIYMLIGSAFIGGLDDILNIKGLSRRSRTVKKTLKLAKVHKSKPYRAWLILTLPWTFYKRFFGALGSTAKGRGLLPHEKILFQVLAGGFVAFWLSVKLEWTTIGLPFIGGSLNVGPFVMTMLIIFIVVFMANAVNFTDGLDGLSAGSLIITFTVYMFISWQRGFDSIGILLGTTIGSLLAYLWFNVKPARYQLGDVGSIALGAMLTAIAFAIDQVWMLSIFGGIFVIEILSVVLQSGWKILFGKRLFKLTPLHHHFEYKGYDEETIVMRFWIVGIMLAFFGMWLTNFQ